MPISSLNLIRASRSSKVLYAMAILSLDYYAILGAKLLKLQNLYRLFDTDRASLNSDLPANKQTNNKQPSCIKTLYVEIYASSMEMSLQSSCYSVICVRAQRNYRFPVVYINDEECHVEVGGLQWWSFFLLFAMQLIVSGNINLSLSLKRN